MGDSARALDREPMRAALVGIDFGAGDFDASLEELALLAHSAGAEPITTITAKRSSPDAAYFVGSGKADEIGAGLRRPRRSKSSSSTMRCRRPSSATSKSA